MGDRCIFVISGVLGFGQTPGGLPPPVISLSIHEKILSRWWQCQACGGITTCNAYQLHLNPLVSTTNPVTGLDNLGQPLLSLGTSSSYLESSSSDSDDIPNNKNWKPSKRMITHKPRQNRRPKERRVQHDDRIQPSTCHFCSKSITLSCTLLDKFLSPICTLSGENLILDRFIPAGIQCCHCDQPHFLSSRPFPPDKPYGRDHSPSQPPDTQNPSKKSHIFYQPSTAPNPIRPRPPCAHCLHPPTLDSVQIHEQTTQESCGGDCWVISAYGERLTKIKDLFTPASPPWLLTPISTADQGQQQQQQQQGLLHRHQRLCEEYLRQCSLDLSKEIARKARLHTRLEERAGRSAGRDHLRRSALGEGTAPGVVVNKEMAAAEGRVAKAEQKVAEAERRRGQVLEKMEEARVWVLGVLNGALPPACEHGLDSGDSDEDGGDDDGDAEMDGFSPGVGGDENNNADGAGSPAQNYDGDTAMDNMAEEGRQHQQAADEIVPPKRNVQRSLGRSLTGMDQNGNASEQGGANTDNDRGSESQNQPGNRNEEINWHDAPEPVADPSYARYCLLRGIPLYEIKPRRR